jgi:hypothetical protein
MRKFVGKVLKGTIVSLHMGKNEDLSKQEREFLQAKVGGFEGDSHQGPTREAYEGDWEPKGTVRRNERQWSGISVEELSHISAELDLTEQLRPSTVGANLCVEGIPEFSLLIKGTKLVFESGAVLLVEEYNPPCSDMGAQILSKYSSRSGKLENERSWLRPAAGRRGVVGVIDVPGEIKKGDTFEVRYYEDPVIRLL